MESVGWEARGREWNGREGGGGEEQERERCSSIKVFDE
jgi:hypothetical protein